MPVTISGTSGITTPGISSTAASTFSAASSFSEDLTLAGAGVQVLNNSGRIVLGQSGSVLQVVSATATSNNSTTSSTYVTTNHSVTITPSSSTSTIWINLSAVGGNITGTNIAAYTIYRGGSNIAPSSSAFVLMSPSQAATIYFPFAINYLDSPATTSATTYTVYMRSQNGSGTVQYGSNPNSVTPSNVLTVMEIAA
jgi:hypothetical protein